MREIQIHVDSIIEQHNYITLIADLQIIKLRSLTEELELNQTVSKNLICTKIPVKTSNARPANHMH